jgi:hypothetical protein
MAELGPIYQITPIRFLDKYMVRYQFQEKGVIRLSVQCLDIFRESVPFGISWEVPARVVKDTIIGGGGYRMEDDDCIPFPVGTHIFHVWSTNGHPIDQVHISESIGF